MYKKFKNKEHMKFKNKGHIKFKNILSDTIGYTKSRLWETLQQVSCKGKKDTEGNLYLKAI